MSHVRSSVQARAVRVAGLLVVGGALAVLSMARDWGVPAWTIGVVLVGTGVIVATGAIVGWLRSAVVVLTCLAGLVALAYPQVMTIRPPWRTAVAWSGDESEWLKSSSNETLFTWSGEELRARSVEDGNINWRSRPPPDFELGRGARGGVLPVGDVLLLVDDDLPLPDVKPPVALSPASGEQLWEAPAAGLPVAFTDRTIVTSWCNAQITECHIQALDQATGEQRWEGTTADQLAGMPMMVPGGLWPQHFEPVASDYVALTGDLTEDEPIPVSVRRVDDGEVTWSGELPWGSRFAVMDDRLVVVEPAIDKSPGTSTLVRAIPLRDDSEDWTAELPDYSQIRHRISRLELGVHDHWLIGGRGRRLYAEPLLLDLNTGETPTVELPQGTRFGPLGGRDPMISASGDHVLLGLNADDDDVLARFDVREGGVELFSAVPSADPDVVSGEDVAWIREVEDAFGRAAEQLELLNWVSGESSTLPGLPCCGKFRVMDAPGHFVLVDDTAEIFHVLDPRS